MERRNTNIPSPVNLDTTLTSYKIPLSAIALWPPANHEHPERRFGLAPFAFFMQFLTTVVLAGRIWARITRRAGSFGGDDVLIILAWSFGTAFTVASIYGVIDGGYDRHIWDIELSSIVQAGFAAFAIEALFLSSTCLTKISILLFYRRLVDRSYSQRMQRVIYGLIIFTVAYFIGFGALLLFSCQPISSAWLSLDLEYAVPYRCMSRRYTDTIFGVVSVASDAYVLLIPELVIHRLKLQRRKKIVLFALFGSGAIVVGAGIARTVWLSRLHTDPRRDLTWIAYELLIWTTIEMQGNIMFASAPAMKSLVSAYFSEGDKPLESLIGYLGEYDSRFDASSNDWPLKSDAKMDMEKPLPLVLERALSTVEEKPPTPPKDDFKRWEESSYGGITVTERYSVVSELDAYPLRRGDGSEKVRKVLGY
ncbi:hypothetical protein E2P81_ATG00460 [Venturia nashicola]|uniref:Rhodopsin domain-containing protein n=1 Tax=Venturia nashicola TaxID=86259 RepID=A0A4Z1PFG3_9PEZI|nr:hypothetical protein E6O75_ATG00470 [Venturia nashicola]TLD39473.1 hypothetical protein E2P81_ATG00460 [Venturia nashicola]